MDRVVPKCTCTKDAIDPDCYYGRKTMTRGAVTDRKFNPTNNESVDAIKAKVLELEEVVRQHSPEGRRQSIALTHLEACGMFAVKAIFED